MKPICFLSLNGKLNSYLPEKLKNDSFKNKVNYLLENRFKNGFLFTLLSEDIEVLNEINSNNKDLLKKNLKTLNVDDRDLESKGFNEDQKNDFYEFSNSVRILISN